MSLPNNVMSHIGMTLLQTNFVSDFVYFSTSSKNVLNIFINSSNLFDLYKMQRDSLQILFTNVWGTLIDFKYNVKDIDIVISSLQSFEKTIKQQKIDDTFINQHFEILSQIKFELNYILKEPNVRSMNRLILGYRDRIFGSILSKVIVFDENRKVTNTFNNFIMGITYFEGDHVFDKFQPAYHRTSSCPPRNMPNKKCTFTDNINRMVVERCYLERLIYDKLWYALMGTHQDIKHMEWLENTKMAFLSCFPDTTIDIELTFQERNPIMLTISKSIGKKTTLERYIHPYDTMENKYIDFVRCVSQNANGVQQEWVNTFQNIGTPQLMFGGDIRKLKK